MEKSAVIRARISPEVKVGVEKVLDRIGLSMSDAIGVFCHQVIMNNGIPFEVKIPNAETLAAIKELEEKAYKKETRFSSAQEMFNDLGI